jgi:hypothetical protein
MRGYGVSHHDEYNDAAVRCRTARACGPVLAWRRGRQRVAQRRQRSRLVVVVGKGVSLEHEHFGRRRHFGFVA